MQRVLFLLILALLVISMSSCAAAPNDLVNTPNGEDQIAGFWQGLWHGIISPFAFIVSLFSDNVGIYEVHNNGNWYNFGFMFGISIIFGGSGGGAARRRR
jgi:hypothetical protein